MPQRMLLFLVTPSGVLRPDCPDALTGTLQTESSSVTHCPVPSDAVRRFTAGHVQCPYGHTTNAFFTRNSFSCS